MPGKYEIPWVEKGRARPRRASSHLRPSLLRFRHLPHDTSHRRALAVRHSFVRPLASVGRFTLSSRSSLRIAPRSSSGHARRKEPARWRS